MFARKSELATTETIVVLTSPDTNAACGLRNNVCSFHVTQHVLHSGYMKAVLCISNKIACDCPVIIAMQAPTGGTHT
jgi:hypothetical protein